MEAKIINEIHKGQLKKDIEELRDILNEICVINEKIANEGKTLLISQRLDELIVKYMNEH